MQVFAVRIATLLLLVLGVFGLIAATRRGPTSPRAPDEAPQTLTLSDWALSPEAKAGRQVYVENCIGCHGELGEGDGEASEYLSPRPRNLQRSFFKFRSTPSGQLPTTADLLRTVTIGLPGSSMPAFRLVSEPERRAVVAYVLHLASFGIAKNEVDYLVQSEGLALETIKKELLSALHQKIYTAAVRGAHPVPAPPPPPSTSESVERGRVRYEKECASCHGKTGIGDGPSSFTLRDWQDTEILPRDFTSGVFRAGSTAQDLYLRLKCGLNGTPMPAISGDDDNLWSLVHFIQSLKNPKARPPHPLLMSYGEVGR